MISTCGNSLSVPRAIIQDKQVFCRSMPIQRIRYYGSATPWECRPSRVLSMGLRPPHRFGPKTYECTIIQLGYTCMKGGDKAAIQQPYPVVNHHICKVAHKCYSTSALIDVSRIQVQSSLKCRSPKGTCRVWPFHPTYTEYAHASLDGQL